MEYDCCYSLIVYNTSTPLAANDVECYYTIGLNTQDSKLYTAIQSQFANHKSSLKKPCLPAQNQWGHYIYIISIRFLTSTLSSLPHTRTYTLSLWLYGLPHDGWYWPTYLLCSSPQVSPTLSTFSCHQTQSQITTFPAKITIQIQLRTPQLYP